MKRDYNWKKEKERTVKLTKFDELTILHGSNLIDSLQFIQDCQDGIRWYFYHTYSKLWKAIKNHIKKSSIGKCCLIEKIANVNDDYGHGISFVRASMYQLETAVFMIEINVNYDKYDEEEDAYIGFSKNYTIECPIDLELNFTDAGFKKWLKEKKKLISKERKTNFEDELKECISSYKDQPLARKIASEIKGNG